MPLERWSEKVVVVHMADDPQFSEDLDTTEDALARGPTDAVLDLGGVRFVNSSNIARLLKVRKQMVVADGRLVLCNVNDHVWSTFLITGLDKVFEFSDNVTTALATLQMA